MAKRKLSSEQRVELREEMKKAVEAGQKPAEILDATAKKYGITTITARWYLKSLDGGKSAGRGRKARRGRPPGSGRRRGRPPGRPSGLAGMVDAVQAGSLKKAKAAQRLFGRWQNLLTREGALRKVERKVGKQLAKLKKQTQALGDRISRLVGR